MRFLTLSAAISILLSLLAACGSGDGTGANTEATPSFQDGLTAEDILDQVREVEEQAPETARFRRVTDSAFGGRSNHDVDEVTLVGQDVYVVSDDGDQPASEFLYYKGKVYTRNDAGDAWVTKPEYEAFANAMKSAKEQLGQSIDTESLQSDAEVTRGENESVGGEDSYQLVFTIKDVDLDPRAYSETLSNEFEKQTGEEIPTIPADYIPRTASYDIRFWYAVSDLTLTRYQIRLTATQSGEGTELMRRTFEILERNQPLSLPGPLPKD